MTKVRYFRIGRFVVVLLSAAFTWQPAAAAPPFETPAEYAILVDHETATVLYEKNADTAMPPASMSKLMTLYLVFERLAEGSLSLEDTLPVSEKAWRMGGSKMFVKVGDRVRVEDLLRGVIVQSGNDACIVLAEGLAGSEDYFATLMTERGREIGLINSSFRNSTGWPDPDHYMSARDLALLSLRIIEEFPKYYTYFAERTFTYGVDFSTGEPITQPNRNRLLFRTVGVDGLKTGHTAEAGYSLAASALRDGRRLVLVVAGLGSESERALEAERLLEFGYRNFKNYTLFKAGETVDRAATWLGDKESVALVLAAEVKLTLSRRARRGLKVSVVRDEPLAAPIAAGQEVGRLEITTPETEPLILPLLAQSAVGGLGPVGRVKAAFGFLLWGASSGN